MAIDTRQQSYRDPICQISSLYVVWFHLQALSYLIENKEGNTQKKLKIAISRPNIRIFKNEMECDDLSSRGSLITKKKAPQVKNCCLQGLLAANFEFSTKPEVVFKLLINGDAYSLAILQRHFMPNFKSLCCLVRSTDAFIFNRE